MKLVLGFWLLFSSAPAFCVFEVGEKIPNLCWTDEKSETFCLDQAKDTLRVLNYNTGWCPDCVEEMQNLVPRVTKYKNQPVTFLSLSGASFESSGDPTPDFLKAWREKFSIPFRVLASPKDVGRRFFDAPLSIPNFVVIDKNGTLVFKTMEPNLEVLFSKIDELL